MEEENVTEVFDESELLVNRYKAKKKGGPTAFAGLILGIIIGAACTLIIMANVLGLVGNSGSKDIMQELTGVKASQLNNSKLYYLVKLVEGYYYKDVDETKLVDGVYKGLLSGLEDPYSEYYTAKEYEDLMIHLTGDYAGIGALLSKNKETGIVTISKVYANTPAEKSGLLKDDMILYADGEFDGTALSLDEFVSHIRGEKGTDVVLTIVRDGKEMEVTVTRDEVITPTVEHQMLEGNTGYIQVSQFTNGTYDDFVAAYEDLESQGMTQVIFDMRSNGGGLLDSVVKILDYLLPKGTVVYTEDRSGKREDFDSDDEHFKSIPMTVLVDGNTASAAEIFTGAIRDFKYGTIIGTLTFGKGIVQSTIPLPDGSAIKLTTNSYFTPSGECIQGVGINPDIELEYKFLGTEDDSYDVSLDNQIQKALEVLGVSTQE